MQEAISYKCRTGPDLSSEVKGNPWKSHCGCGPQISGGPYLRSRFRCASRFGAQKILAILCRANFTKITKDLRKVMRGFEATGHSHVEYRRVGSAQHFFSTLNLLAQNKLMRGLAR